MSKILKAFAVAAVLTLVAAPASAQLSNPNQPTETTLYFHIWDTFSKFVINTEPYNATFFETGGVNFPTTSGSSLEAATGDWDFNTIYGYSTAGPVEYDFNEDGRPRLHPERGIAADVELDPTFGHMVYLYIDARGMFGGDESPGLLPTLTFRATMREGDQPGEDLDAGPLIMSGQVTATLFDTTFCPTDIPSAAAPISLGCAFSVDPSQELGLYESYPTEDPQGNPMMYPDENNVIEIAIPMNLDQNEIKKTDAYNIRLDWYQEPPVITSGEDQFALGNLRMVLDNQYLPRLETSVMNPVYVEFLHPQVAAGTLLIHTGVNSPWGTYDINEDSIKINVDGPTTPSELREVKTTNKHVHGLHDQAAEITYLWKFRDDEAQNGDYSIDFSIENARGNAVASAIGEFTIEGKKIITTDESGETIEQVDTSVEETPFAPVLFVIAGLAALVLRRRA